MPLSGPAVCRPQVKVSGLSQIEMSGSGYRTRHDAGPPDDEPTRDRATAEHPSEMSLEPAREVAAPCDTEEERSRAVVARVAPVRAAIKVTRSRNDDFRRPRDRRREGMRLFKP